MRKFIIQTKKGVSSIQEVEIQLVTAMEDPSILWRMKPGEYLAKVLKPESMYEKQNDGRFTPPVLCWFAFHDSEEAAKAVAEKDHKREMERISGRAHLNEDANEAAERMAKLQEEFDKFMQTPALAL